MSEHKHIRPAVAGSVVRHEDGRRLADEGETVTESTYWQRRLRAGDVVETQPEAEPAKPAAATTRKSNRE